MADSAALSPPTILNVVVDSTAAGRFFVDIFVKVRGWFLRKDTVGDISSIACRAGALGTPRSLQADVNVCRTTYIKIRFCMTAMSQIWGKTMRKEQ